MTDKLEYQLRAEDPDGDRLQFVLENPHPRGSAVVTPDGLLIYTPCEDCKGEDTVNIEGILTIKIALNTCIIQF